MVDPSHAAGEYLALSLPPVFLSGLGWEKGAFCGAPAGLDSDAFVESFRREQQHFISYHTTTLVEFPK